MSDSYYEVLVKRKSSSMDSLKKVGLIALVILTLAMGILMTPVMLLGTVAAGVGCWFFFPRFNVEYEYLIVNGELDIDAIYSQTKRKKAAQYDLSSMDIMAPLNSYRLEYYNNNQALKVADYSSGEDGRVPYAMIVREDGATVKVLLELDREIVEGLRRIYPNKVYLD